MASMLLNKLRKAAEGVVPCTNWGLSPGIFGEAKHLLCRLHGISFLSIQKYPPLWRQKNNRELLKGFEGPRWMFFSPSKCLLLQLAVDAALLLQLTPPHAHGTQSAHSCYPHPNNFAFPHSTNEAPCQPQMCAPLCGSRAQNEN